MENNDQYFENLAKGKKIEIEMGNYEAPEEEVEVELAKAKTTRSVVHDDDEGEAEGQLTIDVYQTPDAIIVESAIAGVKPEDIDVNVTTDSISIRGTRRHEQKVEDGDYLYQECYWGRFARSIILPQEIDPENAEVMFKNGILTIRLPKVNRRKSKKLNVRTD